MTDARISGVLWLAAAVIMFLAAGYQERTGPTKEFEGSYRLGDERHDFALVRSGTTDAEAPVILPVPAGAEGVVHFRRYPTDEGFTALSMDALGGELQGLLPIQPAAGKLEYYVTLESPDGTLRIPAGQETLILRYKDPVPLWLLVPHVVCMFLGLLTGVRAALGAAFHPVGLGGLAWGALALLTLGGLVLGPLVQNEAFGAYWTGWPFGYDLTDNKTLIMWAVWAAVALIIRRRSTSRDGVVRVAILLAAAVMLWAYVIPHSLRGSEFDYEEGEVGSSMAGSWAILPARTSPLPDVDSWPTPLQPPRTWHPPTTWIS